MSRRMGEKPPEMDIQNPLMELSYPKRGDKGARDEPKTAVTWRAAAVPLSFVKSIVTRGYRIGDVITDLVLLARDVMVGMDAIWIYVLLEAKKRGVSNGQAVAHLASEAIIQKHPDAKEMIAAAREAKEPQVPENNKKK